MPRTKKSKIEKGIGKTVKKVESTIKEEMESLGIEVGRITHYFDKIGVAVVEVAKELGVGDLIRIKGTHTDFKQKVRSMQVEHKPVEKAKKGEAIGLQVEQPVREHDRVYKIEE